MLQDICRVFPSIAEDTLMKYAKEFLSTRNPEGTIRYMLHSKQIYKNADGFYGLLPEMQTDINAACAYAVYFEMNKDDTFRAARAKYPYDYIFEIDHKLYLLLDYKKEGLYKLNFLNHSYQEKMPDELAPMPLIMLINGSPDSIDCRLLPQRYMIARVNFDGGNITGIRFHSTPPAGESPHYDASAERE